MQQTRTGQKAVAPGRARLRALHTVSLGSCCRDPPPGQLRGAPGRPCRAGRDPRRVFVPCHSRGPFLARLLRWLLAVGFRQGPQAWQEGCDFASEAWTEKEPCVADGLSTSHGFSLYLCPLRLFPRRRVARSDLAASKGEACVCTWGRLCRKPVSLRGLPASRCLRCPSCPRCCSVL